MDHVQRDLDLVDGRRQGLAHPLDELLLGESGAEVLQLGPLDLAAAHRDLIAEQQEARPTRRFSGEEAPHADVELVHPLPGTGEPTQRAPRPRQYADLQVLEAPPRQRRFQGIEAGLVADGLAQQLRGLTPAQVPQELLVLLVVEQDPRLVVEQRDDDRGRVEDRLDQGLLLAQGALQGVDPGHIPVHGEEVVDAPVLVQDRGDRQFGEVVAPLAGAIDQGPGPGLLALDGVPEPLVDAVRGDLVGEDRLVLAEDLVPGIAGEAPRRHGWRRGCWPWRR